MPARSDGAVGGAVEQQPTMNEPRARAPFHVLCKPIGPLCNLRCTHCFYLDKTALYPAGEQFRMSAETLEAFTRQYLAAQPDDAVEVAFAWQGGEPTLLGVDFFRQAVALQRQYARPGLRITNALQTNGTMLTDEWGPLLHDEGFLVGLSLDGPERLHDRYRRDAQDRGSWARAMAAVEVLTRHRVEFNTLTCIQRDNADHGAELYAFLKGLGSRFMQFIPVVAPRPVGGVTPESVTPHQFGIFLSSVLEQWLKADVGQVFVQHFDVLLGLLSGYPSSLCVYAEVCGRNVALEHNGDVYQCDHFVFPEHRLGNLHTTPLAALVDSPAATAFGRAKRDRLPQVCRQCPWLPCCRGGCPAHRLARAAGGEHGLNYLCEGYRLFLRRALPYFSAMAECLRRRQPAADYRRFLPSEETSAPGRNDPCPCGSGRKYKHCCGRAGTARPASPDHP